MSFLSPLFLAGLAALSVPIILHLLRRESRETIAFPSLMFLRKIPYQSVRRQRIRHWPLLILRCLALVLLASAFARPFLDDARATGGALGARELVILLDRSYSMGYDGRWERATAAARDAVGGLADADRATLVVFDERADVAVRGDPLLVRTAIDTLRPSDRVTRYGPPIALAGRILDASERPRREVVMISDFQRRGWDPGNVPVLPGGTEFRHVDLGSEETANTLITGIEFGRERIDGREHVRIVARIGTAKPGDAPRGALEINGRQVETAAAGGEAGTVKTIAFAPVPLREGATRGVVRLAGDPLAADNAWHFALSTRQTLGARIVQRGAARPRESLYLRRALAVGDQPPIEVEVASGIPAGPELDALELIVLNGTGWPDGAAGRRLAGWVADGGGVLMVAGADNAGAPRDAPLPATVGELLDRTDRGGTFGIVDRRHPVFEPFGAQRGGALAAPRFFRYRRLTVHDSARVIAWLDDGAPALVERTVGEGRVLVWSSSLDNSWSDFPVQPAFLPFVHRLALYASGFAVDRPWEMVGSTVDLADAVERGDDATAELSVATPSGRMIRPEAPAGALALEEQGFYEIRTGGSSARLTAVVAANADRTESDLTRFDPSELALAVAGEQEPALATAGVGTLTREERGERSSLWWYLLLVATLVLGAEAILANRLAHRMR